MSYTGILHNYAGRHAAFEFAPTKLPNVLIAIGGMTDGLLTVPYVQGLPEVMKQYNYSVIQIQYTSSFKGWGTSSLQQDIKEIAQLIRFLKSEKGGKRDKIMLIGHSTGSQDVMTYLLNEDKYKDCEIVAAILQGSASDREAMRMEYDDETLSNLNKRVEKLIAEGKKDELLPTEFSNYVFGVPITAYRWWSIMCPGGDDDYFSSDLDENTLRSTFGKIKKPFLIAYSGKDNFVPDYVDKAAVIEKWRSIANPQFWSKNSGLVEGADHFVTQSDSQQFLYSMIKAFMEEFDL
ncbi:hypothetical protein KAFR_0H02470 [Kazachstania africana CBS 2517]|uniref:DUF1749-domain-containing protein n=1 Tax=Kazachstania africana (strain ATCC 22294 / BCRC 22015 / CBS 2517 / CECT 1963 / NBRC 1671 / NRRL Y-8276) TaxID=1071382 RepID=H2AZA0_KAZAF|nr:hypothetical protein KAFR_0H02470 [Kazachstania africana CBS 2517]CCF59656.1 hypothetical protein KAFR_0H02470 [Kazachstania africana CBS 2517]